MKWVELLVQDLGSSLSHHTIIENDDHVMVLVCVLETWCVVVMKSARAFFDVDEVSFIFRILATNTAVCKRIGVECSGVDGTVSVAAVVFGVVDMDGTILYYRLRNGIHPTEKDNRLTYSST